jgi:hypothetical protein
MDFDVFKLENVDEYISLKSSIFIDEPVQPTIVARGSIVIIVVDVVVDAPNGVVDNENDNLEEFDTNYDNEN